MNEPSKSFKPIAVLALGFCLALPGCAGEEEKALQHARELLRASPLIDGHNDVAWLIREETQGDIEAFGLDRGNEFETDIPKLRAGQVGAQFWSVWIPGESTPEDAPRLQLEQIDIARRMIEAYPDDFELALSADDIERIFEQGKIASLLGMEGGYGLNNSMGALRMYYDLGVRYMTLVHNVTLDWVDAGLGEQRHGGLTAFGRLVVREMNRTGMMVDLSHATPAVMHQALDASKAPVIWSHASARALVDHPRNVPDDVLERISANGGVVMVTFVPSFLSKAVWEMEEALWGTASATETVRELRDKWFAHDEKIGAVRASIDQLADHIEHVRDVAGIDCVGIGSDYWGMPDGPVGLEDASGFPRLFAALILRGWDDDDLKKLAGQNLLRAMRRVESVAAQLQRDTKASNATIAEIDRGGG
jgi:membrane dipeptidase